MSKNENEKHPFHPHLVHHMAAFQTKPPGKIFNMMGFMDKSEDINLQEQELFYRAINYRGS